jgi:molecular chaperone GrpE
MTNKKDKPLENQEPERRMENMAAEEENQQVPVPQLDELLKQLADTQARADEYKDGWQRSVADFQNYRKRVEAERAEMYQSAAGNIIKRYLPILDDLERALQQARPEGLAWADGIELIYRKLQSILESEGIKRIEAEGQMFDPNFHEAIGEEHADGAQSGQVVAVVRNGYMLGDKVLRPAMVRVAR